MATVESKKRVCDVNYSRRVSGEEFVMSAIGSVCKKSGTACDFRLRKVSGKELMASTRGDFQEKEFVTSAAGVGRVYEKCLRKRA